MAQIDINLGDLVPSLWGRGNEEKEQKGSSSRAITERGDNDRMFVSECVRACDAERDRQKKRYIGRFKQREGVTENSETGIRFFDRPVIFNVI